LVTISDNCLKTVTPSLVGISWALQSGGVITKTLNGSNDENATRYAFDESNPMSASNYNYIINYGNPGWASTFDTEADVYSISFSGYSGKFVLDENKVPVLMQHSNIKIEPNFNDTNYTFKITTPDGTKYYFGGNSGTEKTYSNNSIYANTLPHPTFLPTSYYLTKIESLNGETVNFVYSNYEYGIDPISYTLTNYYVVTSSQSGSCPPPCPPHSAARNLVDYKSKVLAEINSSSFGKVTFAYSNYNLFNSVIPNGDNKLVDVVSIYNNDNRLIKQIDFNYTNSISTVLLFQMKVIQGFLFFRGQPQIGMHIHNMHSTGC
jgi:hypothetical protein